MGSETYDRYKASAEWRQKATDLKAKRNYTCEICQNKIPQAMARLKYPQVEMVYSSIPNLIRFVETFEERKGLHGDTDVHHKTYERLGKEREEDLAVVCAACHVVITENKPRLGLDGAWGFALKYMADIVRQLEVADEKIIRILKADQEMELPQIEEPEDMDCSYPWLLPPKDWSTSAK